MYPQRHPARAGGPVLCREPHLRGRVVVSVRHRRSVPQRRRAAGHRRAPRHAVRRPRKLSPRVRRRRPRRGARARGKRRAAPAASHATRIARPTPDAGEGRAGKASGGGRWRRGWGPGKVGEEREARGHPWLHDRPGSAGPVPGIAVSDHQSLETSCLRDALRRLRRGGAARRGRRRRLLLLAPASGTTRTTG